MHVDPDSICHVLVHLQLRGIAACWALDLFVSICHYRSAPFETALRKLNRKEEARPRMCSLVSTSDRFVNRAMASIMALVVGFAMIRPTFPIFFLVKYSAIFSLVQVPASLPHKSPQISIVLPRPRWRVKVFHGPYEASGASRLQTVPICASCWVKWVKWVKGSESAESAEPICTACQVSKPGPGPHTISYFFLWLNSSRERWLDLLEDFKNLRDVFLPLNRASGISRWQCECQKQIGTGHKQPTICCGQTRRAQMNRRMNIFWWNMLKDEGLKSSVWRGIAAGDGCPRQFLNVFDTWHVLSSRSMGLETDSSFRFILILASLASPTPVQKLSVSQWRRPQHVRHREEMKLLGRSW